jgi:hypothetical protein
MLDPLLSQLADRVRSFSAGTGISLNRIAKLIGTDPSNFSAFCNGRAGLSAASVCRLMELLNSSKRQIEMKLNAKPIQIRHLQQDGEPMRFDVGGSWIPIEGGSGDPNDTTAPSGDDIADTLRQVDDYHRQAREAIAAWFATQKATVNRSGVTEGPRRFDDNTASRTAGSRKDRFSQKDATTLRLEALIRKLEAPPAPKYVPYVFDERAHAIRCEENRCAEVDNYYKRKGSEWGQVNCWPSQRCRYAAASLLTCPLLIFPTKGLRGGRV